MSMKTALKAEIARDGRSLTALARASGVNVGQLSRFMRGERGVAIDTIDALLKALGLEVRLVRPRKRRR